MEILDRAISLLGGHRSFVFTVGQSFASANVPYNAYQVQELGKDDDLDAGFLREPLSQLLLHGDRLCRRENAAI